MLLMCVQRQHERGTFQNDTNAGVMVPVNPPFMPLGYQTPGTGLTLGKLGQRRPHPVASDTTQNERTAHSSSR